MLQDIRPINGQKITFRRIEQMVKNEIDITRIPFSRYGAYVSVTRELDNDGYPAGELIIHSVRRRFGEGPMFALTFGENGTDAFSCHAIPEVLTVENENGYARIYIRDDDTIVIDSYGLDLRLKHLRTGYGIETGKQSFRMISGSFYCSYLVEFGKGIMADSQKTNLTAACENGRLIVALAIKTVEPKEIAAPVCPDEEISAVLQEWQAFLREMPSEIVSDTQTKAFTQLTWYNLWSCFVRAEDVYAHDTMLMAKKGMTSTWSWDHCFNALAMAHINNQTLAKEYALNQFTAPFILQSEHGVLPDLWNPGLETIWGTTKPPVHGWCFAKLMDRFDFTCEELETVYGYLKKWTEWWINYSDTDHDGIPDYPRGCDSGWDNSTLFDIGHFLESPDLPAFLILQMKTLARISEQLGHTEDVKYWLKESEAMFSRMMEHCWNGNRFVAKQSRSHLFEENPTSLLSLMPLVLGDILPKDILNRLVDLLEQDFLTENGLATEMPSSVKYQSNGYWRGPIWAPSTYLIVDGLRRAGYNRLAHTIAERYCRMSCITAKGNYENFDALTGLGWCAPGYTWSASVYMLLHWEYGC